MQNKKNKLMNNKLIFFIVLNLCLGNSVFGMEDNSHTSIFSAGHSSSSSSTDNSNEYEEALKLFYPSNVATTKMSIPRPGPLQDKTLLTKEEWTFSRVTGPNRFSFEGYIIDNTNPIKIFIPKDQITMTIRATFTSLLVPLRTFEAIQDKNVCYIKIIENPIV